MSCSSFFFDQIKSVVEQTQREQISNAFQPLLTQLKGKSNAEIVTIAKRFHEKNTLFEFGVEASDGRILYKTKGFTMPAKDIRIPPPHKPIARGYSPVVGKFSFITHTSGERFQFMTLVPGGTKLYMSGTISGMAVYDEFIEKTVIAFVLILLASILTAAVFARRIARPIRKIAGDTKKMSRLEPIYPPDPRQDEIGQLAGDVYKMYKKLKSTIRQLETEIVRRKEMEENQRYFFSAASHELKTPIAATGALLEGMLEKVIEPSEYPGYLRECLKMMNEQSRLVSEILEIVKLSNDVGALERKQMNLKEFVADLLPSYHALADMRNLRINVDVPENIFCTFDRKLLGKAFSNVVMNAVQNTPEGGQLHICAEQQKGAVRLCILNSDVSIPKEILPKLFEPFYREDQARNRSRGRSGLGLTIVKKALDLMEIPFSLENTDEGVLFCMYLPY